VGIGEIIKLMVVQYAQKLEENLNTQTFSNIIIFLNSLCSLHAFMRGLAIEGFLTWY
jgi:hypothetical protein